MSNEDTYIFYPDKDLIEMWLVLLKSENIELKLKLPKEDEYWYKEVLDTIERIKWDFINGIIPKAAHLFYYLDKDHNFVDGNKRTTIVIVHLFLFVNGYKIKSPNRIEVLAKKLARSIGARNKEDWMRKIEREIKYNTEKMPD